VVPSGGSTSLELRWIEFGAIPEAIFEWLGPFREWIEQREDRYLVDPCVRDLGVKIKGGIELDLKAPRGTLGHLSVPGGGRGRLSGGRSGASPSMPSRCRRPTTARAGLRSARSGDGDRSASSTAA
jgi:hypothetical protein